MHHMTTSKTDLINRLSRIEGQVGALKRALETNENADCARILIQVKAASAGLKRFAEAFSRAYAKRCVVEQKDSARFATELDTIISSVYSLS